MNKLILGAAAALMLSAAACSSDKASDNSVSQATNDSISMYYGLTRGGFVLADFQNFTPEHATDQTKEDILKGIQLVFGQANTDGKLMGIQIGATMLSEINQLEEQGVKVDRAAVLKYFKSVFLTDSLNEETFQTDYAAYQTLLNQVQAQAEAKRLQEANEAPEAVQNSRAGKAYIDKIKKNDPEAKTTKSGAVYQIQTEGTGDYITENSVIEVNYVGKFPDGKVFDNPGEPATFSPTGVIAGFREALMGMKKGTKAVVYIPGELAYGVQGVPQAGIGPNQALVFEIEILDVKNAE